MRTEDKTELGNLIYSIYANNSKATLFDSLKNGIERFIDERFVLKNKPSLSLSEIEAETLWD